MEKSAPFIFISYAHKDNELVLRIIEDMKASGLNIWFDKGIEAGTEWPDYIAQHIKESTRFIAFMSSNYIDSKNCRREINYADKYDIPVLVAFLEDVILNDGMDMQISLNQSIYRTNAASDSEFIREICKAKILQCCKNENNTDILSSYPDILSIKEYPIANSVNVAPEKADIKTETPVTEKTEFSDAIPSFMFRNNTEITDYYVEPPVTSIGDFAFQGCSSLRKVIISPCVTDIGVFVFSNCVGLSFVQLPPALKTLPSGIFEGCVSLTDVQLPISVSTIGEHAFYGCSSLTGIQLPLSLVRICDSAFKNCVNITEITIPQGVTTLEKECFAGCKYLEKVIIPESVCEIADNAFENCSDSLTVYGKGSYLKKYAKKHRIKIKNP